jgi:hypothetical protein
LFTEALNHKNTKFANFQGGSAYIMPRRSTFIVRRNMASAEYWLAMQVACTRNNLRARAGIIGNPAWK